VDPKHLQRFQNEARAAASLDHPNIVHVYSVGCERAVHFYAMQYIEGQTLARVIEDLRRVENLDKKGEHAPQRGELEKNGSLREGEARPPNFGTPSVNPSALLTRIDKALPMVLNSHK